MKEKIQLLSEDCNRISTPISQQTIRYLHSNRQWKKVNNAHWNRDHGTALAQECIAIILKQRYGQLFGSISAHLTMPFQIFRHFLLEKIIHMILNTKIQWEIVDNLCVIILIACNLCLGVFICTKITLSCLFDSSLTHIHTTYTRTQTHNVCRLF